MKNLTKNQHYLSQAEQRLNSINSSVKNMKKQRIYAFNVIREDGKCEQLGLPKAVRIESTLSDLDLYSFGILEDKARLNFESAFNYYESEIEKWVNNLIHKVESHSSEIAEEVQRIFLLKFLNTLRNPFTIKETLQVFEMYSNYLPTDPELKKVYLKIDTETKPHMNFICNRYGITEYQYITWLKVLYLLLYVRDSGGTNLFEAVVKRFYENPVHHIEVFLCTYSKEQSVFLSDKGFNKFDPTGSSINYEFNLNYKSHIAFIFTDITKALPKHPLHGNERVIEMFKAMPRKINFNLHTDNDELLSSYNTRTITQAYQMVLCKFCTTLRISL